MTKNRKSMLSAAEVSGAWVILPTPAIPGAEDWRCEYTLDRDATVGIVERLLDAGVDGLLSLGTFGECATLTPKEKTDFIGAVVETVAGRVPYFCGTTALNTREVVRQNREARALGVDGTMLGLPMWCRMETPAAVQFYKDVAEAVPDLAICVYANTQAFKYEFDRAFWAQVDRIPQVICAKYLGIGMLDLDLELTSNIRFMPNEADYYAAARIAPDRITAFWSSGALCGPGAPLRLRDEVNRARSSGDWSAAKAIDRAMHQADATFFPKGDFAEFSKFNISLEKQRMNAAGWVSVGPVRPPYHLTPEPYLEGARKSGLAWARLHEQFSRALAC